MDREQIEYEIESRLDEIEMLREEIYVLGNEIEELEFLLKSCVEE